MSEQPEPRSDGCGSTSTRVTDPRNRILTALPPDELERILPDLERVTLEIRDLIFDVNQVIEQVCFPEGCVCSVLGLMADGSAVETATIGHEGVVGLPVFHGTDRTSFQAFCQVPGEALIMPVAAFRREIARSGALTLMLHRYSQALLTLVAQSSACNRLHTMQERCARWLLLTHDRVGGLSRGVHEFSLTHSFLSQMLGTRRVSVTEAMNALSDTGALTYEGEIVRVLDRGRLEGAACECYEIIRSEFERLLEDLPTAQRTPNPLDRIKASEGTKSTIGDAVPGQDDAARLD